MICEQCKKVGEKAFEIFNAQERIFILTSAVSMMKFVMANDKSPSRDKVVGSSVTTKLLLSFPLEQRQTLIEQLEKSAGIRVSMKDCPHSTVGI